MSDMNQCSMDSVVNNLNDDFAAEHADDINIDDENDFFSFLDDIGKIEDLLELEDEDMEKHNLLECDELDLLA